MAPRRCAGKRGQAAMRIGASEEPVTLAIFSASSLWARQACVGLQARRPGLGDENVCGNWLCSVVLRRDNRSGRPADKFLNLKVTLSGASSS
jgi:hypothetical protein